MAMPRSPSLKLSISSNSRRFSNFRGLSFFFSSQSNPIEHPLASPDAGYRTIDVLTDLSGFNNKQLAKLLMQVNSRVTDNFIQELRRRVSMLERPLLTARAHRKSYIYSNYNPKYAQYLATILRTYYNFCDAKKDRKGNLTTPAMRIGIADKVFDWNDILYFK